MTASFLQNINRQFEEKETMQRAQALGIGYVDFKHFIINPDFVRILSKNEALEAESLVLDINGKNLKLAVMEPDLPQTQKIIRHLHDRYEIQLYLCSRSGFEESIHIYDTELMTKRKIEHSETDTLQTEDTASLTPDIVEKWKQKIIQAPSQIALEDLKILTLRLRGTDIHLQPFEQGVLLRIRIDGILHDIFEIPFEEARQIITRIKYEGGMKSNVTNVPQDGHLHYTYKNRRIDFRVSMVPSSFLESVVIRVLDSGKGIRTLKDLGFTEEQTQRIQMQAEKNQGMILITGPTGSGKTTTLYSILKHINKNERKIVTLEDPIEYQLSGVSQSQINERLGYTFETGFEALLRHDPDVILLGEIRSAKTAHLAIQASLTGHLVLSTVHTNSAVETITRLRNLEVENFNIGPALHMLIAQRLVRQIQSTSRDYIPLPQDNERFMRAVERIQKVIPSFPVPHRIPKAPEMLLGSAYFGRIAIAEIVEVDTHIQQMILDQKSTLDIETYLKDHTDFLTMYEHGILKVLQGETTLEEIERIVG